MPCCIDLLQVGEIGVYEYVYEYGKNVRENSLPTYSYTYSYTRISRCRVVQDLAEKQERVVRAASNKWCFGQSASTLRPDVSR
jgi:hypothetical protein